MYLLFRVKSNIPLMFIFKSLTRLIFRKIHLYLKMIIITDTIEKVKRLFSGYENLLLSRTIFRKGSTELEEQLFQDRKITEIEFSANQNWEKLFFIDHSHGSQFDILTNLLRSDKNIPPNIACVALTGEKFHGFRNRVWQTLEGNIHLSIYFVPQDSFENLHVGLLVLAAVSILETIDSIPNLSDRAKTKWVNDITIDDKKVAGIITQSFSSGNIVNGAVIGIGLNVEAKPTIDGDVFTNEAACLRQFSDSKQSSYSFLLLRLLEVLSQNIKLLNRNDYQVLWHKYITRSAVIGRNVEIFSDPIEGNPEILANGKVVNINENLELIIEGYSGKINKGRLAIVS